MVSDRSLDNSSQDEMDHELRRSVMFIEAIQIYDPSSVRSDMWRIMTTPICICGGETE